MPLDMPLGERKIVVLPRLRVELPDVPGLDRAASCPCETCVKVMSLK